MVQDAIVPVSTTITFSSVRVRSRLSPPAFATSAETAGRRIVNCPSAWRADGSMSPWPPAKASGANLSRIAVDLAARGAPPTRQRLIVDPTSPGLPMEKRTSRVGSRSAPKARISVWADETSRPTVVLTDVTLRLDGTDLPATYLSALDKAGYRQINAMLPPQMEPGAYQVAIQCRGEESPAHTDRANKIAAEEPVHRRPSAAYFR